MEINTQDFLLGIIVAIVAFILIGLGTLMVESEIQENGCERYLTQNNDKR